MTPAGEGRSPALRLLLAAAAPAAASGEPDALGAAAAAVTQWDDALATATDHGLLAQLASRIAERRVAVPPGASARLHRARIAAAARAAVLARELARLHALLGAAGVETVPWKGPTGAVQAHGDAALREPEDLDLLVRRGDLARAVAALRRDGFEPLVPVSPRLEREIVERQGAITLEHPGSRTRVDLASSFWHPAFGHPFCADVLIPRAAPLRVGDAPLPALPPEESLLALAVHGCGHGWERICWAADVAALASRPEGLDWERLLAEAGRLRVRRALRVGLGLAARLFPPGGAGPALREAQADPRAKALAAAAALRLLETPPRDGPGPGLAQLRFQLAALEGARERARFLWRSATVPNPNEGWLPLPPALFPLHRLARPLRLAVRHGPRLLRGVLPARR